MRYLFPDETYEGTHKRKFGCTVGKTVCAYICGPMRVQTLGEKNYFPVRTMTPAIYQGTVTVREEWGSQTHLQLYYLD